MSRPIIVSAQWRPWVWCTLSFHKNSLAEFTFCDHEKRESKKCIIKIENNLNRLLMSIDRTSLADYEVAVAQICLLIISRGGGSYPSTFSKNMSSNWKQTTSIEICYNNSLLSNYAQNCLTIDQLIGIMLGLYREYIDRWPESWTLKNIVSVFDLC